MDTVKQSDLETAIPADFDGWWKAPEEWVEEVNRRRNGWSGMIRLRIGTRTYYVKKQCNHLCRSLRHPFGWPTVTREYENILRLKALGVRTPEPVFEGVRKSGNGLEALLITEELTGFSALAEQTGLDRQALEVLAIELGHVLGTMHRAHLQHSCLYDKHVMVRWQNGKPEIALIDLEKLRKPLLPWRAKNHDMEQLKRHQSIWSEREWQLLEEAHAEAMKGMAPGIALA